MTERGDHATVRHPEVHGIKILEAGLGLIVANLMLDSRWTNDAIREWLMEEYDLSVSENTLIAFKRNYMTKMIPPYKMSRTETEITEILKQIESSQEYGKAVEELNALDTQIDHYSRLLEVTRDNVFSNSEKDRLRYDHISEIIKLESHAIKQLFEFKQRRKNLLVSINWIEFCSSVARKKFTTRLMRPWAKTIKN